MENGRKIYRINMLMVHITGLKAFDYISETAKTVTYISDIADFEAGEKPSTSNKYSEKYRFFDDFEEAKQCAIKHQTSLVDKHKEMYYKSLDCLDKLLAREK